MSQVLSNAKVYVAHFDLSGDINSVVLNYDADDVEDTSFGNDTHQFKGGLKQSTMSMAGGWSGGASNDAVVWTRVGTADVPVSVGPTTGAAGEAAYLFLAEHRNYTPAGGVGELLRYTSEARGTGPLISGDFLFNGTEIVTGDGTAFNLGAVAAGETLYAALHVISASAGDTLDVTIQSDSVEGFGGTPETQITFTQVSGGTETSEWKTKAGAITDIWYRARWTIAGAGESFQFVITMGIR